MCSILDLRNQPWALRLVQRQASPFPSVQNGDAYTTGNGIQGGGGAYHSTPLASYPPIHNNTPFLQSMQVQMLLDALASGVAGANLQVPQTNQSGAAFLHEQLARGQHQVTRPPPVASAYHQPSEQLLPGLLPKSQQPQMGAQNSGPRGPNKSFQKMRVGSRSGSIFTSSGPLSREHQKHPKDRELRTVVVTGLPLGIPAEAVRQLLEGFEIVHGSNSVFFMKIIDGKQDGRSEPGQPEGAVWHVVMRNVGEARRAAKLPPIPIGKHVVTIRLAVQLEHCAVCNISVNSDVQMQQHLSGTRHRELLKQHLASCMLILLGVSNNKTEMDVKSIFHDFAISEGGIIVEPSEDGTTQTVCITFVSKDVADQAQKMCADHPHLFGEAVEVVRQVEPFPTPKAEVPKPKLRTPAEVHLLVCSILYSHLIDDIEEVSPALFSRIYAIFLSCNPYPFTSVRPRDRFFKDFEMEAGSKRGLISLEAVFTILQRMDANWSFELPTGALLWFEDKVSKYGRDAETGLLSKATFLQIRNLKWAVYQVTQRIMEKILANKRNPPPLINPLQFAAESDSPSSSNPPASRSTSLVQYSSESGSEWEEELNYELEL